ncbi:MAG: hypothetical protein CL609_21575 [Anaerolineaceae bacterium]|nr:hypothetical protein [Anaerolineaceae bacterium]
MKTIEAQIKNLINNLKTNHQIRAVGLSGDENCLSNPDDGDIDLFVYCSKIPDKNERFNMLSNLSFVNNIHIEKLGGGHWGIGDCCFIQGIEVWILYFTVEETIEELNMILTGDYQWRLDNYFYPLGRLAMWKKMTIFYDPDGVLKYFKDKLSIYPKELAYHVIKFHIEALADNEDLERAVYRKDIFFYHFALELALDHFLQVLFALNNTFFPSRKRSMEYIQGFEIKPMDCENRLTQVILNGGVANTLGESYELWSNLVQDLKLLVHDITI